VTPQYHFRLGNKVSYNEDDFFVSPSNELAFKQIKSYPNWGNSRLSKICLIYGPEFSGKTHLAHIFAKISGAKFITEKDFQHQTAFNMIKSSTSLIIDDLDQKIEKESLIFNIINECMDRDKYLLLLSSTPVSQLEFITKDCKSRINAINQIAILAPTIEQSEIMFIKNFADRQITVSFDVIKYLVNRIERSYREIYRIINQLDKFSLEQKRKISINLVKEVCEL
jgi:chromosomal replication initiation ATPase DnaA